MALPKPVRLILLLALLSFTAACERWCPHKPEPAKDKVLALVVEVTKDSARVISRKEVIGRLPDEQSVAATSPPTRLQDLTLEFEVRPTPSEKPVYVGRAVAALVPIVEGVKKQPQAVDKRVIVVAV